MGKRSDPTRRRLAAAFAASLLCLGLIGPATAQSACRDDTVMMRGDWGTVRFNVEIADDPEEQRQGLMHRESMPISSGMLFVYPTPRASSFWMRNTLIPLDMLFVDAQGTVTHIHHKVLAVLEINGGLAKRLGIVEGAQLRHPAFAGAGAVWPC